MLNLDGYIRCYDTLKNKYVNVPVTIEIETYMKRSSWREEIQNKRYTKRIADYEELFIREKKIEPENNLEDELIKQQEIECLKQIIDTLDTRYKSIINMIYYEDLTLSAAAKKLGISASYISRLIKKINKILKTSINRMNGNE